MKIVFALLIVLLAGVNSVMETRAEETKEDAVKVNGFMAAITDTAARKEPKLSAQAVYEIKKGQQLLVTEEETDGWYEIYYQGVKCYVPAEDLQDKKIDMQSVDRELEKQAEVDKAFIESLEMQREAARRAKIWGGIILALIIAVFTAGIVSAIKNNKNAGSDSSS